LVGVTPIVVAPVSSGTPNVLAVSKPQTTLAVVDTVGGSFGPPTDYTFGHIFSPAHHGGTIVVANVSLAATDSDILDLTLETSPGVPLMGITLSQTSSGANPVSMTLVVLVQFFSNVTITLRVHSENGNTINVSPNACGIVAYDL